MRVDRGPMPERPAQALDLQAFLRARRFDPNDRRGFARKMFVTCWAAPGFHAFWRQWNPLYGYVLYRLYLALGGRRHQYLASLVVFVTCGFVLHDLVGYAMSGHLGLASTFAFALFWAFASISRRLATVVDYQSWPPACHVALNVGCVLVGLVAGALASPAAVSLLGRTIGR